MELGTAGIRNRQASRISCGFNGAVTPDGGVLFYPMDIAVTAGVAMAQLPVPELPPPTAVELRLRGGRCLHFDSTMDLTALTSLIRAVETA